MMLATQTCACNQCQCTVEQENAVQINGQFYCSEACAQGHSSKESCGHAGCEC